MAVWRAGAASSSLLSRLLRHSNVINVTAPTRTLSTDVAGSSNQLFHYDINSQYGRCMPLADMHIQAKIHSIEMNPGQGGKLVRAPGTFAKILKEPTASRCLVRLPSGVEKWIDAKCQATIGTVPSDGNKPKKLYKAGQNRWRGIRPTVRGVAMNPVDHPHGGGEGKSKSSGSHGKGSRTPWGKPTKGGYKTGPNKRRKKAPMTVVNPREVPEYELNPLELQVRKSDGITKSADIFLPFSQRGSYQVAKWNGTKVSVKILDKDCYTDPESMNKRRQS